MPQRRIAIAGASGRMGRMLVEATLNDPQATLVAAFDQRDSAFIGRDAAEFLGTPCGVKITDDAPAAIAVADCVIDFTRPEGTLEHLALARDLGKAMVTGTTGFSADGKQIIAETGEHIPVGLAPDMAA